MSNHVSTDNSPEIELRVSFGRSYFQDSGGGGGAFGMLLTVDSDEIDCL